MKTIHTILFLTALVFSACSEKAGKAETPQTKVPQPLQADSDTQKNAETPTTQDITTYFAAYKAQHINKDDKIDIKKMDKANGFAQVEHYPTSGEIIGVTFLQFAIFRTAAGKDIIAVYMHACVEGSCNMAVENLNFYDENWKEITKEVAQIKQIKDKFEEGKTATFDQFLAKLPQKKGGSIEIVAVNNDQMYEKGVSEEKPITKLTFDIKAGKFN